MPNHVDDWQYAAHNHTNSFLKKKVQGHLQTVLKQLFSCKCLCAQMAEKTQIARNILKVKKKKLKIIAGRGALSHEAAGGFYFLTPLTVIAKAGRKDKLER